MKMIYDFIPMGSVTSAEVGKIYIDVGNHFGPGVIDHHHATAPHTCSARLALDHPDYIHSQIRPALPEIQIITHWYPDLDAISGVYFARLHLQGLSPSPAHSLWADYVCQVDRGETVLDPAQPITPYLLFILSLQRASESDTDPKTISTAMLAEGLDFIDTVIAQLEAGNDLKSPDFFKECNHLQADIDAVRADWQHYLNDLKRAEQFECRLPEGQGFKTVPALWIEGPTSSLFKAWARGDAKRAGQAPGFVFLGIQVNPQRAILSVMPDSGVTLKGLGEALEQAETTKRQQIGKIRTGKNRTGYDSPDPWYDGRSPLHAYTIVDAPHEGSVLSSTEIRQVFEQWIKTGQ